MLVVNKQAIALLKLTVYIKEKALKIYRSRDSVNNLKVARI